MRAKISDQDWKRVHYLGRVPYDRFLSMMQVSRVHIYLTYPFVLSWSLLEAMSAGVAIVASDTPPVKEAMVDCETGLFVDFFDQVGLVEKTCQLLDDEALREKLGTAARQHIVDHYDLKRTCLPKHLECVDQLAKQPVWGQINLYHNDRFKGGYRHGGFVVRGIGLHPLTRASFPQMRGHCGLPAQRATCGHQGQVH